MWSRFIEVIIHVPPDDKASDNELYLKQLFLGVNLLGMLALVFLAIFFALFTEYWASLVYALYAIITAAICFRLRLTGQGYHGFVTVQIIGVQLVGMLGTLALGGFANSGYVFVWAFLGPLASIVFTSRRRIWRWLLLYLMLMIATFVLQPNAHRNQIPPGFLSFLSIGNLGGASALIAFMLYWAARQLHLEQARSEQLLLNILPKEIATRLKRENGIVADYFAEVSILFADVMNFTPLAAHMHPVELVNLLNAIFFQFDALVDKYGLEKIKTIGDCYMVASGVPRARRDHAQVLVQLALEMQALALQHEFLGGERIILRMGISSGPVVAGVIGRKKFTYDLWGDAVNVASRMASHGQSGAIQITHDTYQLIKDDFICEPQGTIPVKGKGQMTIWHVIGRAEGAKTIKDLR